MTTNQTELQKIPGVDKLLTHPDIRILQLDYKHDIIVFCIQQILKQLRENVLSGKKCWEESVIIKKIAIQIERLALANLKPVLNATGVLIHTNLGRAPFGEDLIDEAVKNIKKYNNLEFNLDKGERGHRDSHISGILKFLTGADDVIVVNNNAAAVMLILRTFAKQKEVIVSRGELIEIGGAFRVPDILKASDCEMVEVGTTNKTKLSDYENAITDQTAILLKTHKSNYTIKGFTKEVSLNELVQLGNKKNIPVVFDIGSGLLKKVSHPAFDTEPDVKEALSSGVDLLCFSGDKLLGGPQAGIIAGKQKYIDILRKEPMMRALRVGKTTLSFLESAARFYLDESTLFTKNLFFKTLLQDKVELKAKAEQFSALLSEKGISSEISTSQGRFGGGTLPDKWIESYQLKITDVRLLKQKSKGSEKLFYDLLQGSNPVLSILKSGDIYFDVLTLESQEINLIVERLSNWFETI
ncbi:MAG: L-seryl-tRNA(Sec) selenium transferase [Bacteroidales bacterium]|nr:L-seryl-tRNA(Sec) selenium transferase [Bacteroidales bacterium]